MSKWDADPFKLLAALRLICWYTGELEGHDALVRADEHLRRSGIMSDPLTGKQLAEIIECIEEVERLRKELQQEKDDNVMKLLLGRLFNRPGVGRVIL